MKNNNIDTSFLNYSQGCAYLFNDFFSACTKGNIDIIKDYFQKFKLYELTCLYDVTGKNPLHYAIKQGHITVVEYLISKGFGNDLRDKLFRTPLHIACVLGHAAIAEFLIRSNNQSLIYKDL